MTMVPMCSDLKCEEKKKKKKRERKGENLVEVVNLGGDERDDARSLRNALDVTELLQV